ncbi:uncharacterized protein LOC131317078 [Rhododendron vialii]|uniref:uncharacterized protein LOC131317078 n=1 Tax=Rhododendron vialii TaxID=182163 RepID=UPI00265EF546|nr:uncharacterized protein LOC131317078 [Rhododendron vialii]
MGRPIYTKPHSDEVDQLLFPKGFRVPEFLTFSGEDAKESTVEHVARFQVQCGEAGTKNKWKLRLFPNSLTATAFTRYINLSPNSIQTWRQMEDAFHQQFYRVEPEVTMADLSSLCQLPDEGVETYLARFKKKKFYEAEFTDLFELSAKAARYERILRQEQDRMADSKGTYYRDPNYEVAMIEPGYEAEVAVAELINKKPYFLKAGRLEKADFASSSGKSRQSSISSWPTSL